MDASKAKKEASKNKI